MPKKITIRIVSYGNGLIHVEHDDVEKLSYKFAGNNESQQLALWEASSIMKSIEITLNTLGYSLDEDNLYIDMSLMVGNFYLTSQTNLSVVQ